MARIGQEASGVGQHSYEVAENAEVCQRGHLLDHAGLIVVEPPCAALLDLADRRGILEAADDGADRRVVHRIQRVQDRFRKLIGRYKRI